ncbi:MAG: 5'-nucleotidase [Myxococcota bacterium]|jgi:5'-nucleotidase
MTTLLVTNDDGVNSPALVPLVVALERLDAVTRVNTLVPDNERSWISKALSRFEDITLGEREAVPGEPQILTTTGTPADCANLGIHRVFDDKPGLVVSGINIGLNHGFAFTMGSGTVGAASEAAIAGLPAIAFSVGVQGGHGSFVEVARSDAGAELWRRCADVAADIVATVLEHGLPDGADILNVNFPQGVTLDTPRVVTEVARVGYDGLFSHREGKTYAFEYQGLSERRPSQGATDMATLHAGKVSITPLQLPSAAPITAQMRATFERG